MQVVARWNFTPSTSTCKRTPFTAAVIDPSLRAVVGYDVHCDVLASLVIHMKLNQGIDRLRVLRARKRSTSNFC